MTDEVAICNRALAAIGARATVSSIQPSDGSKEANACALLYYPTRDALLRAAHWDFARTQVNLSQLKAATDANSTCPIPWAFEYAYPSNCLKMRYMIPYVPPSDIPGGVPLTTGVTTANIYQGVNWWGNPIAFVVATDLDSNGNDSTVLLTNQCNAVGIYTKRITNPDLFDVQFQEALVESLAAKLVPALALNLKLMQLKIASAESMIAAARMTNGNEGPMVQQITPDWMRVRTSVGLLSAGVFFNGWDNMSWPSYSGF